KQAPGAHVRAAEIGLAAEGGAGPAVKRLLAAAAARLGSRGLADVLRLIGEDPESFIEEGATGQPDRVRVPIVGGPLGLLGSGWRNFFCDQDFEVPIATPEWSSNKTLTVEYADRECFYSEHTPDPLKWSFLDYPAEKPSRSTLGLGNYEGGIVMEIENGDVILGTEEKVQALLDVVRRKSVGAEFILVNNLCMPVVMGDDMKGLARRCEEASGCTAVSWAQKEKHSLDNFGQFFRSVLGRSGFFDGPGDPLAVNLFHFPSRYREDELSPLLEELGLRVNVSIFPMVDFTAVESLPKAAWQVFCETSFYADKVRELLAKSSRPVVSVRAPYGIEGTRESLREIAAAVGQEEAFAAAWASRLERVRPRWEAMKKEAAGYRLAFVVSEATLPMLSGLRFGQGAPLLKMIGEMGFGIDLLCYDQHGLAPELAGDLRGAQVAVFRSPWELEKALREGGFQAVYSDMFFDWRVSSAGKSRFSSRDFEMGLEGALRSLKRLLAVCRLPFYGRYAAHLARLPGREQRITH
ncbi:MAG: nitrogenase component 1, partial [Elusimicrobiota bacterium]